MNWANGYSGTCIVEKETEAMPSLNAFRQPQNLNDWPELRNFWLRFKEGDYASRIYLDEMALQRHFVNSLQNIPSTPLDRMLGRYPYHCGILLGYVATQIGDPTPYLRGVIAVKEMAIEDAFVAGDRILATNILGVYVDPHAGRHFSDEFMQHLEQWARARGHRRIQGNGRAPKPGQNNYKLAAVHERYGFEAAYMVVQRDLPEVPNGQQQDS